MSTETPIYDQVATESTWTPEELRPPFDLGDFLLTSYQKVEARHRLREKIARRARAKKRTPRRTTRLP